MNTLKVTVWNEYRHEKVNPQVAGIYPEGIHNAIAGYLKTAPAWKSQRRRWTNRSMD